MSVPPLFAYVLRLADTALVLGHRLSQWSARAPTLEEDIALSNLALDLIGQARMFYEYAGRIEGKGRDEDSLAYLRDETDYRNLLIAEQPNGDFAATMARQLFFAGYAEPYYAALKRSKDETLAAIGAKAASASVTARRRATRARRTDSTISPLMSTRCSRPMPPSGR